MSSQKDLIANAYQLFAHYPAASEFCTFCYTPEDIKYYLTTSLRKINVDRSRVLLWETGDHWENTDVYKHYLPRLLEILLPPIKEDELYPGHILETLRFHQFHSWAEDEKRCVVALLDEAQKSFKGMSEVDWFKWNQLYHEVVK